jgi:hypothetical protein
MLTAPQRAALYTLRWPERPPLQVWGDCLYAVWLVGGAYYRSGACYGSYPHGVLDRLLTLFPETPRLHLFGGAVKDPDGVTFDIRPECNPTVLGDVMEIARHLPARHFATVLADPPYDRKAQETYGTRPFCKRRALKEVAKVMRPGGVLAWLDVRTPIWEHRTWEWGGVIALQTGTMRVIRSLTILRRKR